MSRDLIAAVILLLIALGYYHLAGDINQSALADEFGAAGLPAIYAAALAALALALAAKAVIAGRRAGRESGTGRAGGGGRTAARAAGMLAIGVAYVALVGFAGYLVSLAGVIAIVALYHGERMSLRLAGIAAGGAIGFWIFFDRMLGIEMPPGFWPGLWGS